MSKMKEARKAKGLTVLQLAAMVDLNPSSVSRIERGVNSARPAAARRIAAVLGMDPADIVFMERNQEPA